MQPADEQFIYARLPGRDCWRLPGIHTCKEYAEDAVAASDLLSEYGYLIFGWDMVWDHTGPSSASDPKETPQEMISKVKDVIDKKNLLLKKKGKLIILMHDHMFRESRGNKQKLEEFIQGLKNLPENYKILFRDVSKY